jgi:hypothetical protein
MSKSAKNKSRGKGAGAGQLWLPLPGLIRGSVARWVEKVKRRQDPAS